jgi:hypothetical protein
MSKQSSINHIRTWVRTNGDMSEDGKSITYSCAELEAVIKEAKQMEKEQIIEADLAGVERTLLDFSKFPNLVGYLKKTLSLVNDMKEGRDTHDNGIEYYNETYGGTQC